MNEIVITIESPLDERCTELLGHLRTELFQLYPEEIERTPFDTHQLLVPGAAFLLATLNGRPVGCGAIQPHENAIAEVKRMFVLPEARGKGVGRRILEELERKAPGLGYTTLRLETGLKQPEAIELYETSGFHRTKCYGVFVENPLSVCFEKRLKKDDGQS